MALTFQAAFCEQFRCLPAEYERVLLGRVFYFHARLLAPFLRWLNPDFFEEDLAIVRDLADMTNPEIIGSELSFFHGRNVRDTNWVRKTFLLRVSAGKLRRICIRVCKHMAASSSSVAPTPSIRP